MWFGVITLFPEMLDGLKCGITGRAILKENISIHSWNPRDYTSDKHKTVDDRPFGGGPGMLMKVEPLQRALAAARLQAPSKPTVILLSPQGRVLTQSAIPSLLAKKSLIFIAGRYEGIDQRFIAQEVDEEWSIGDYVLSGGELAAMVMIDSITRLIPNALGHEESAAQDSLSNGLLKYPQYTRPISFAGVTPPEVLLSGNHQAIERWRLQQSLGMTWLKRPDLLENKPLTEYQKELLKEFIALYKP